MSGKDNISGTENNIKIYLQLLNKLMTGKNIGVPAQTMIKILTDIVLNLIANCYNQ
jgi:hypothetical protein